MASKVILNPQEQIMEGVNTVADAVEITLGAKGLFAGMAAANPQGTVYERTINADGVSVAKAIHLKDEAVNFSAQIMIEAAKKQVDQVGDGTTVTLLLARAIMREAAPIIASGEHPQSLAPGFEIGIKKVVDEIRRLAQATKKVDDLIRVASISAKDEKLGKLIGETLHKVGTEAVVTAEESKSQLTTVDHQTGMQLDQGYYHELFVTNPERMEASLEMPYILVTDKPINSLIPLSGFLNSFIQKAKKLVIISPEISRDSLSLLLQNKLEGKMLPLCIKAPGMATNQKAILQDIAALTGATYITEDAGHQFENITMEHLGRAQVVTSTSKDTIISGGMGKKKEIQDRIDSIKAQLTKDETDFAQIKLRERLGKLTSGVAVIYVGGHTEIEMKERRERVIDGIAATRAAMREGIVPGGEIIYLNARKVLDKRILAEKLLYKVLERPFRRLVDNAGYDGGQMLERLGQSPVGVSGKQIMLLHGVDVRDGFVKDMAKEGIIDPAAVALNALQNANSVACKLLCTKVIIVPDLDDKDTLPQLRK